jgi:hypothetical protein
MTPDHGIPPSGQTGPEFPEGPRRPVAAGRLEEEALLAKLRQPGGPDFGQEERMYAQALRVASDDSNPDWMPIVAHNMRELMEKLIQKMTGTAVPARRELRGELNNFAQTWRKHAPQASELPDAPSCKRLLDHARTVMDWYNSSYPSRRRQVEGALVTVGAAQAFPPNYTPEMFIDAWLELQDYFVDICHHNTDGDAVEFRGAMKQFADSALVLFARTPATTADLDRIDRFIEEHE